MFERDHELLVGSGAIFRVSATIEWAAGGIGCLSVLRAENHHPTRPIRVVCKSHDGKATIDRELAPTGVLNLSLLQGSDPLGRKFRVTREADGSVGGLDLSVTVLPAQESTRA